MSAWERRSRALKLARTYVLKARDILWSGSSNRMEPIDALSVDYQWLLEDMLDTAYEIVKLLPDTYFYAEEIGDYFGVAAALGVDPGSKYNSSDDPYEAAKKLVALIEKRRESERTLRLIKALESNEGRSPDETAAHLAHAQRLRAKLDKRP